MKSRCLPALALALALAVQGHTDTAQSVILGPKVSRPFPRAPRVVTPHICPDSNHTQYSGYLPDSPIFFWFFPSRSDPSFDPIGLWTNGGPGSSALNGLQDIGPCAVRNQDGVLEMDRSVWSFNDHASLLLIDNPLGVGFSYNAFPAGDNIYDGAKDVYAFLQAFYGVFPQYAMNPLSLNGASYGGHYLPAYASYIQHMNARLSHTESLWDDIWADETSTEGLVHLNLTSVTVGNGFINEAVQSASLIDFACGGAESEGVPFLADEEDCAWARARYTDGARLMATCRNELECAAAGLYASTVASFPYASTGLNDYNYHVQGPYDETSFVEWYNRASVQAALGVIDNETSPSKRWDSHSSRVHEAYILSGDWHKPTDYLFERVLRSGISVLKYEGMADWICNYIGIRQVMSNLTGYRHQERWNALPMRPWHPTSGNSLDAAGQYKCLRVEAEGQLCYVEVKDAGHVVSTDKPMEASLLVGKWMSLYEV